MYSIVVSVMYSIVVSVMYSIVVSVMYSIVVGVYDTLLYVHWKMISQQKAIGNLMPICCYGFQTTHLVSTSIFR